MNIENILSKVDHTLLKQDSTWTQIKSLCDDAIKFNTASVCVPPCFVKQSKNYIFLNNSNVHVCTVIGFPNGYSTTSVKCFETRDAILNGADEIDMVINIGWVKEEKYDLVLNEINNVKEACQGRILKVIIETCLLTNDEIVKMCNIISNSNADYIKTSTGFSKFGATFDTVKLINENISNNKKIKAAGGINSLEDAQKYIELGASRLGTSRIVNLVKEKIKE